MWQETNNSLYRKFEFEDFDDAFAFMETVAECARGLNHHPEIRNSFNVVELWITTHEEGRITDKDRELAAAIDRTQDTVPDQDGLQLTEAKMFADGGSRGNPGPSALGYAILDMDDAVIKKSGTYLGITTNNQAEYRALEAGLTEALALGIKELHVYMDSLLVINQVRGVWKIKNAELMPLHASIRELISKFDHVGLTHVPRAFNKLADSMVNECLDAQTLHK